MEIIFPMYGLLAFRDKIITRDTILQAFQPPDETLVINSYAVQLTYKQLGLQFYHYPNKAPDPPIWTLAFVTPFVGRSEEGIVLNHNTMNDVIRWRGIGIWRTTDHSDYWWMEFAGISYYIARDHNQKEFPFQEGDHLHKPIIRITVPLHFRPEGHLLSEFGEEIRDVDDYCTDGLLHNYIYNEEQADLVCTKCGYVQSERIISEEYSSERVFSKDEQDRRQSHGTPMNPLIPDMQLATMIDKRAPMPETLRKAVKWDSRYTWKQRNMIQATSEIKRIGEILNLPQHIKVHAIRLYRKAFALGLLKGRSIRAMVAAAIYYACSAEKVPRTLQIIVNVSDSTFHQISKCYQSMIKELKLPSPTIQPRDLISGYISSLNLPHNVEMEAARILERYQRYYSLSGKDPKGLCAAALYVAAQNLHIKISQTRISRLIGITEVTLRNRLREIQRFLKRER